MKNMSDLRVLVYGDFMLDEYIDGDVSRISPEAPVPILAVKNKETRLGGAGNVVNNLSTLGIDVKVFGFAANDTVGKKIQEKLKNIGADTENFILDDSFVSIMKTRIISKNHQFLRMDQEEIQVISEEMLARIVTGMKMLISEVDVVIISDYAKGSVVQEILKPLLEETNALGIPTIVDPKGVDYLKYHSCTICTPNLKEFEQFINQKIISEEMLEIEGIRIAKEMNCKYLVITRSEKGMTLIDTEQNSKKDFPVKSKEVIDVTGAGDTVVAALASFYGSGSDINQSCILANKAASVVISKLGTSTFTLNELGSQTNHKVLNRSEVSEIMERIRKEGKQIVFTNGCFDIMHYGHVHSFKQAKEYGDVLVVAINSDESIKGIKGDKRPVVDLDNRLGLLSELEVIDFLVVMNEYTPEELIRLIEPNVVVKGKDWEGKEMPESDVIKQVGAKLNFVDFVEGISTTSIIEKIMRAYKDE